MITIYHNPRCGKSREALQLVTASGKPFRVVEYLKNPLDKVGLKELASQLSLKPLEMMRTKEPIFIEQYKGKNLSDEALFDAMAAHPILMERAIVSNGTQAVIARPPEKALEILV